MFDIADYLVIVKVDLAAFVRYVTICARADGAEGIVALDGNDTDYARGYVDTAADAGVVPIPRISAADAHTKADTLCPDGSARNADVAAAPLNSATDARTVVTARGCDDTTTDGDVAAASITSATDARTIESTLGRDGAALDFYVAAVNEFTTADARSEVFVVDNEPARALWAALDDERLALSAVNAGILAVEVLHRVRRAVGQHDGGVAQAGEACPQAFGVPAAAVVDAVDGSAAQGDGGAIGYRQLQLLRRAVECAREHVAVNEREVGCECREVNSPGLGCHGRLG